MSRGFLTSLAGIAMTLFAWFGPWAWPACPAFPAIGIIFGSNTTFAELPIATRAAAVAVLIIVNAGFWGGVFWLATRMLTERRRLTS